MNDERIQEYIRAALADGDWENRRARLNALWAAIPADLQKKHYDEILDCLRSHRNDTRLYQ